VPRKGWTKLAGTSERYVSPDGHEVSRRQYDNERAKEQGWSNRSEYERRYEDKNYLWALRQYQRANKMTISQARAADRLGGDLNKKLRAAKATGWGKTQAGRDPRGPMSKLLVDMGMRDPSATYAVGDTDGGKR